MAYIQWNNVILDENCADLSFFKIKYLRTITSDIPLKYYQGRTMFDDDEEHEKRNNVHRRFWIQ